MFTDREEWEDLSGKLGAQFEVDVETRNRDVFERAVALCPRLDSVAPTSGKAWGKQVSCTASCSASNVVHICSMLLLRLPASSRTMAAGNRHASLVMQL